MRVHGRAARALANQSLPFSVCTILRDEEIYTPIDPEQEEKNRDIRSRYNGRLFLSWLQDVDDKWEKIKVGSETLEIFSLSVQFITFVKKLFKTIVIVNFTSFVGTNGFETS